MAFHGHKSLLTVLSILKSVDSPSTWSLSAQGSCVKVSFLSSVSSVEGGGDAGQAGSCASRKLCIFSPLCQPRGPSVSETRPPVLQLPLPTSIRLWSAPFLLVFLVNECSYYWHSGFETSPSTVIRRSVSHSKDSCVTPKVTLGSGCKRDQNLAPLHSLKGTVQMSELSYTLIN